MRTMKKFIFILILFKSFSIQGQDISAYIKSPGINKLTLKEFKAQEIVQLSDTSLKIISFVIYFACNDEHHKTTEEDCNVSVASVLGNSLKATSVLEIEKKFEKYFYIILDN